MHLERLDHGWTALNTSVNDYHKTFEMYSLSPLAEVTGDTFNISCSVNANVS